MSVFDITMPKSGLLKGNDFVKFLKKYIPADAKIEDMPIPLSIVATDYYTGKPVIFRNGNVLEAVRASISIPVSLFPLCTAVHSLLTEESQIRCLLMCLKIWARALPLRQTFIPDLKVSQIKKYVKTGAEKIGIKLFKEDMQYADENHSVYR